MGGRGGRYAVHFLVSKMAIQPPDLLLSGTYLVVAGPMSFRKSTQLPRKWELSWVLPVGLRKSRQWRLLESNQDNPYEDESADRSPARDVPSLALPTLEERRVEPQIDKSGPSHREQMDAVFRERPPSEEQHPSASTLVSAAIRRLESGFTGNRLPRESLSAPMSWVAPKVEDYLHGEAAVLLRSPGSAAHLPDGKKRTAKAVLAPRFRNSTANDPQHPYVMPIPCPLHCALPKVVCRLIRLSTRIGKTIISSGAIKRTA